MIVYVFKCKQMAKYRQNISFTKVNTLTSLQYDKCKKCLTRRESHEIKNVDRKCKYKIREKLRRLKIGHLTTLLFSPYNCILY